ncbi:MAG TPA: sigma-70 family RNA polymerase sigma factor [Arenimonas sp.]|uniref:RNA polymerase sigma factor n=1 Tax=Arenimonas sp. TaxID=1872635 RepID=UPI002CF7249D|nr:sigma-70 family RNA polymerase sigma factor [Arenimonas sp.]HMB55627.1 sigma-70 family RNA polymerase sigma factor [Arenimonas sp.]
MGAQTAAMATTGTTDSRQQFHALLEQHRKIVFKVANTYSRLPEDRADLAQEIAAQLWRAFPDYDPARTFSTWMYRIALNVAISFLRSHQRDPQTESLDDDHAQIAGANGGIEETDERVRALEHFIAQLEPLNRALLLLYLEERSYREIADILGISETNVATKISRLKQRIRQDMAPTDSQHDKD